MAGDAGAPAPVPSPLGCTWVTAAWGQGSAWEALGNPWFAFLDISGALAEPVLLSGEVLGLAAAAAPGHLVVVCGSCWVIAPFTPLHSGVECMGNAILFYCSSLEISSSPNQLYFRLH